MFESLLIANRGEIAVRIIRTCRRLGVRTIAVYSDADAGALHVREADQAEHIGPAQASESYLNIEAILAAAESAGAEAIHPGYGFLSENAGFAVACAAAGIVFVGPSPDAIQAMGDKVRARQIMARAGVPVVPGYDGKDGRPDSLRKAVQELGFPLIVKAAAGGGGRGMRVVRAAPELDAALEAASREAASAFGDGRLFIERLIEGGRHVEAQIFGSRSGEVVFLGERDCSVQRRHQKVVEETPSPAVDADTRARIGEAAVKAAQAVRYAGAGSVEFLLSPDGQFYFLEMNTRLQVEHPVTEEVLGIDLVEMQLLEAAGDGVPLPGQPSGHAIEFRLYAEDAEAGFLPRSGVISEIEPPIGIRFDSGYESGDEIPQYYDPLLAKLVVKGDTREEALQRSRAALGDLLVRGTTTNLSLLRAIAADKDFAAGDIDVTWLERRLDEGALPLAVPDEALIAALLTDLDHPADDPWAMGAWRPAGVVGLIRYRAGSKEVEFQHTRTSANTWLIARDSRQQTLRLVETTSRGLTFTLDGGRHSAEVWSRPDDLEISHAGNTHIIARLLPRRGEGAGAPLAVGSGAVRAPLPGVVVKLLVKPGDTVEAQETLAVLDAMKMEHVLRAPRPARVTTVEVEERQRVDEGTTLMVLDYDEVAAAIAQ